MTPVPRLPLLFLMFSILTIRLAAASRPPALGAYRGGALIQAMMETQDECVQLARARNERARTTPDDALGDLPTEFVPHVNKWSYVPAKGRFPDPFPWNDVEGVRIDGYECIRTEDGSCDCEYYQIVFWSKSGYGCSVGVKGANAEGLQYAREMLRKVHAKMPSQIRGRFALNGDELTKTS